MPGRRPGAPRAALALLLFLGAALLAAAGGARTNDQCAWPQPRRLPDTSASTRQRCGPACRPPSPAGPCDIGGYTFTPLRAVPGTNLPITLPASTSPKALAERCKLTPGCAGFYTSGVLKLDLNTTTASSLLALPRGTLRMPACWGTYAVSGDPYSRWLGLRTDVTAAVSAANVTAKQYGAFLKSLDAAQKLKASAAAGGVKALSAALAGVSSTAIKVRAAAGWGGGCAAAAAHLRRPAAPCSALQHPAAPCSTLHSPAQPYTACTALHSHAQPCTALHSPAQPCSPAPARQRSSAHNTAGSSAERPADGPGPGPLLPPRRRSRRCPTAGTRAARAAST
jgi:hypothetical protein